LIQAVLTTLVGLLLGTCHSAARATTVLPADLHTCVRLAGVAFAGTVSAKSVEQLETTIVTHVHFTDVKFVKGAPKLGGTRLALNGGVVGNRRVFSSGEPEFEIGKRYIVLAYGDFGSPRNSYLPIVGLFQGFFQLERDTRHGRTVVFDWAKRPVVRVDGHRLVVTGPRGTVKGHDAKVAILPPEEDPGTRMSEESFLDEVARLAIEGTVAGTVVNEHGVGIPYANVIISEVFVGTLTGPSGQFSFAGVPEGTYTLWARRVGYLKCEKVNVPVMASDTTLVRLVMRVDPVKLSEHQGKAKDDLGWIPPCPRKRVDLSSWKLIDKGRFSFRLPATFSAIKVQGKDLAGEKCVFRTVGQPHAAVPIAERPAEDMDALASHHGKLGGPEGMPVGVVAGIRDAGVKPHFGKAPTRLEGADGCRECDNVEVRKRVPECFLRCVEQILPVHERHDSLN